MLLGTGSSFDTFSSSEATLSITLGGKTFRAHDMANFCDGLLQVLVRDGCLCDQQHRLGSPRNKKVMCDVLAGAGGSSHLDTELRRDDVFSGFHSHRTRTHSLRTIAKGPGAGTSDARETHVRSNSPA